MTPGPELDALIAVEVMGYVDSDFCVCPRTETAPSGAMFPAGGFDGFTGKHSICGGGCPRHFSTDISAAWEVIEKLHSMGFRSIEIRVEQYADENVVVYVDSGEEGGFREDSFTAPHAICLAALKAVGYSE